MFIWRRKWQPTPVFLPGKSHGRRSQIGYSPRGGNNVHHEFKTSFTVASEYNYIVAIIISLTINISLWYTLPCANGWKNTMYRSPPCHTVINQTLLATVKLLDLGSMAFQFYYSIQSPLYSFFSYYGCPITLNVNA